MNYRIFLACIAMLYSYSVMAQNNHSHKHSLNHDENSQHHHPHDQSMDNDEYLLHHYHPHKHFIRDNEHSENFFERFEQSIKAKPTARGKEAGLISIPVVVHILHSGQAIGEKANINNEQVESAINSLNDAFSGVYGGIDTKIKFVLAKYQDDCAQFKGINRIDASAVCDKGDCYAQEGITFKNETKIKMLSAYSSHQYLNIWVVEKINGNDGEGVQGFTTFPGQSGFEDGVVILYNAFGFQTQDNSFELKSFTDLNRTLIHEVGHALGLYHTFEGDDMNNDGFSDRCPPFNGCGVGKGDCLEDTPPHERTRFHCNTEEFNVCSGLNSITEVIHNFMNYSEQSCMFEFTPGQAGRMHAVIESERPGWINSNLHQPATMASGTYCLPQTTGLDNPFGLGIAKVQLNDQSFYSNDAKTDGGYANNQCFVFGLTSQEASSVNVSIDNSSNNMERVHLYIDANRNSVYEDSELYFESVYKSKHTGSIALGDLSAGVYAMRVVSVFAGFEISGACHTPAYSQAEDYSLQIISDGASTARHAFEAKESQFEVLTNPIVDGVLRIQSSGSTLEQIVLYDLGGKRLQTFDVGRDQSGQRDYNLANISSGVYMIKVAYTDHNESQIITIID